MLKHLRPGSERLCSLSDSGRSFLFHRKLRPVKQKRSARIAMRQKRILFQKPPPQAEKLGGFFITGNSCEFRKNQNPLLSNHGRYGRIKRLIKITSADSDGGA